MCGNHIIDVVERGRAHAVKDDLRLQCNRVHAEAISHNREVTRRIFEHLLQQNNFKDFISLKEFACNRSGNEMQKDLRLVSLGEFYVSHMQDGGQQLHHLVRLICCVPE